MTEAHRIATPCRDDNRRWQDLSQPCSSIYFRSVTSKDRRELLLLAASSRELHAPWIAPPATPHTFKIYLRRTQRDDHEGYVVCRRDSDEILGVINVQQHRQGLVPVRIASLLRRAGTRRPRVHARRAVAG